VIDYAKTAARWTTDDPGVESFTVFEPATGGRLADFRLTSPEEVDRVVTRADEAFRSWRRTTPRQRAALLRRAAQVLRDRSDEIAEIESRETGKPLEISSGYDMVVCAESFEFFASVALGSHGEFFPGGPIDTHTFGEPYGVVAGIIPFNWPPIHTSAKLAPALAAGNVVVLKPPEQCPLAVLRIIELLEPIFPPGVIQAVPGTGSITGAALVAHPLVRRISFTGSPNAARAVLVGAAMNLTGAMLELGGKDPLIVFPDADLDDAVRGAIEGSFFNQGEACTQSSRLIVHRDVVEEFTARFVAATSRLKVGDGLQPGTHIGALISAGHRDRVEAYIAIGETEGATIAYRGELSHTSHNAHGYFVPPVVFTGVTKDMRIAREEIFGPVIAIMSFDSYDEAIEIANSTDFALVAGVYTRDDGRARAASRDIDAGTVFVNNYNRMFLGTPFGGNRSSGYGREHAAETVREYSRTKSVRYPSGRGPIPVWSGAADA
jgi:acyl-CoA reductase-like NAD-dependent aldehyde dehydrogenase